ncbi:CIC11C00000001608 [Sungouiella intermedia]|uniref:CIC11C00000001608 n=1 Tax=Sungouiella intermedia TaxID=45354 RepID=A0A1L0GF68_9ASCO|nr:CIC11C00000001608 [[Candida] intermedia]
MGFLKVQGTKIVDDKGTPVVLKGCATGGHLNMENFITGYPGHETEHKKVMESKMGKEKFDYFFDKFYDYFWTEKDAKFFKDELKLNCLRIPFNYRHFIDDDGDMFKIKQSGFDRLDRVVDTCAAEGIYTILDLHATPGGQNQDWHSDSGVHKSLFWDFKVFQDVIVNLWVKLGEHYKDNEWVAGYNPLNEPAVADHSKLVNFYDRVEKAIREVDPNHILFLDGNTYAMDFRQFPDTVLPNSVYSIHDYTIFGFPMSEEVYKGTEEQKSKLKQQYERKIEFMKKTKVPVWNGEFGPVYASDFRGDANPAEINKVRYLVLKDQLEIYKTGDPSGDNAPISWSIWLYKDIGFQGLTYVNPKSKFYEVFGKWLLKKKHLGLDRWGNDIDPKFGELYKALEDHFASNVPQDFHKALYPHVWTMKDYISRVLRDMLFSQYAQHEYAELFVPLSFEELDEVAACFKIENCVQREELNTILREY